MYEPFALLLVVLAFGAVRPQWSSLAVAIVAGAAVAIWLFMLEEIPGDPKGLDDVAWYVAFGAAAALVVAFVCAIGVVLGRKVRSRRSSRDERLHPSA